MWDATRPRLRELLELGWIDQMPKLARIQPDACDPIAEAFKKGKVDIIPVPAPKTVAEGLAVEAPRKGRLVPKALRRTGRLAEVVNDSKILGVARALASEGLCSEVSSAASVVHAGVIGKNDSVVCELTATDLKSHREYAEMTQDPIEIDPSLDSLLQGLKMKSVQL